MHCVRHGKLAMAGAALVLLAAVSLAALAQAPPAGDRPPFKSRPLDQKLFDELDRELLQGLPGSEKPSGRAGVQTGEPTEPLRPASGRGPDPLAGGESQNPLANLAQRMRAVERRIAGQDTSSATQQAQQRILSDLEALLEQARKQQAAENQSKGSGRGTAQAGVGSGNPPPGPARDSTSRLERGTMEKPEPTDVKDLLRRVWGHLPDKLRDQMQASVSEQFLPKYERLIEEYYKRLAEDRSAAP